MAQTQHSTSKHAYLHSCYVLYENISVKNGNRIDFLFEQCFEVDFKTAIYLL